jgi:glycosyltransferase 2 family protein
MKRLKDFFWPMVGLAAVGISLRVLYAKLHGEAAADAVTQELLDNAGLFDSLAIIARIIGERLAVIPAHAYFLAALSTLAAYLALAWYDRIALIHLRKEKGISWLYVTLCSFTTYAISHNIGASVFSGGMVRYRAYTAKGLTAAEVAVLVALCSFTFSFGTNLLGGLVLLYEPEILRPIAPLGDTVTRAIGFAMIAMCILYTIGSWLKFKPVVIRNFTLEYPHLDVVWRQWIAAPLELIGAAGIIYFALPGEGNPGFMIVLGAFLLSFSAGLLVQAPGGIGVMEAVFLKVMPGMPASEVFAALLVWRILYLLMPLAISIPVVLAFERSKLFEHPKPPPEPPHAPPEA